MSGIIGTSQSKSGVVGKSQDTAKAWVNFNGGSGAEAVRGDFNVSSVGDVGQGRYKINFKTDVSGDYSVVVSGGDASGGQAGMQTAAYDFAITHVKFMSWTYDGSGYLDVPYGFVQVFGD